jgi:hypothetical protein
MHYGSSFIAPIIKNTVQIKLKKTTYKKVIVFLKERKQNKHVGSCLNDAGGQLRAQVPQ